MKDFDVEVEVLGSINNGYRLKVNVVNLGFHMFGWTARRSDKNKNGWWVQQQSIKVGNGWKVIPEFNKSMPLWQCMEEECVKAIKFYEDHPQEEISDEMLTDEAIKKGIDDVCDRRDELDRQAIPWLNDKDL